MRLPDYSSEPFPPEEMKDYLDRLYRYSVWYSGDLDRLADYAYRKIYNPLSDDLMVNATRVSTSIRKLVHVPIPADTTQLSSSYLFSEAPHVLFPKEYQYNSDRLNFLLKRMGWGSFLLEAAQYCSIFGGVYLKVVWDEKVANFPFLGIVRPEQAITTFRSGIPVDITLWKTLEIKNDVHFRLLERHTYGLVEFALYRGTEDVLGTRISLDTLTESEGLPDSYETGYPGLSCVYIPNMKPDRSELGGEYGQSDYAGNESLYQSIDEVMTSLVREIRVGQGRLLVPAEYLQHDSRGNLMFDMDQEVFTPVEAIPDASPLPNQIMATQFQIRSDDYLRSLQQLIERAVTSSGYSPQSYGINVDGRAESGTALRIRERRSFLTTAKKALYWSTGLTQLLDILVHVDKKWFDPKVELVPPEVHIQDSVQEDLKELSSTVEILRRAEAASLFTRIHMVHPDWSAEQIQQEMRLIQEETAEKEPLTTWEPE